MSEILKNLQIDAKTSKEVVTFLSNIQQIPALPDVYYKIKDAFDDPSISVEYISGVIEVDQAITLAILRLANSPFFGFRNKISSISQAVMLIGLREVYSLVLSISIMGLFPSENDPGEDLFPLKEFWKHSLGVAVASRVIGKRVRHMNPEGLFVAGLIHDIGKVLMKMYAPEKFVEVCQQVKQDQVSFNQVERNIFGFSHVELGALLTEEWAFPQILQNIVAFHHAPEKFLETEVTTENKNSIAIVHLADALTKLMLIGWSGDPYIPDLNENTISQLNLEPEHDLHPLMIRIQKEYDSAIGSLLN